MRSLNEFEKINANNHHLNCKNIRNKAGKCEEYFTDEEIDSIIIMFTILSKKILTITYLVYYMRYQILYTDWVKDVYSNGYMEYENDKYGDIFEFKKYIRGGDRKDLFHSKSSNSIINSYDNKKYELVTEVIEQDGDWDVQEYWKIIE